MERFIISTESCADILLSDMRKNDVRCLLMECLSPATPANNIFDSADEYQQFYHTIRMGVMPTTSQINPFQYREHFLSLLNEGMDVVHFSLSSGLSGSVKNAIAAAREVNLERQTEGRVYVVDTLSATQGMAMLVNHAVLRRNEGMTAEQVFNAAEEEKHRLHHLISVSDLFHLRRGGRVSVAGAVVGTLLNISPILIIDSEGKLSVVGKAKGKFGVVKTFLRLADKYGADGKEFYLAETDSPTSGNFLLEELSAKYTNAAFNRGFIGAVIGAHTGGDTLGLVFLGSPREK